MGIRVGQIQVVRKFLKDRNEMNMNQGEGGVNLFVGPLRGNNSEG